MQQLTGIFDLTRK